MNDPWLMQTLRAHLHILYFAVFKMMISRKNVNQNMLKISYFFEKIYKNLPSSGGSASRSQLASGGWRLCP